MIDSIIQLKLRTALLNLHTTCIGLQLKEVSLKNYVLVVLKHLLKIAKLPASQTRYKKRAQYILFSLILSSLTIFSGASYGAYKLIQCCYNVYNYSWNVRRSKPTLRRTRSQMQLASGARIMYIPDVKLTSEFNENNDMTLQLQKERRKKKIFIKPKRDDLYEHDSFIYKIVEAGNINNSQLFYSKFLNQMSVLSKILIPNWFDKNALLLTLQIFFLVMRTWLSLFVTRLDGQIVRDIISGQSKKFLTDLMVWFLIALPASYTNSAIKLLQRKLSLNFRVNLTRYIHDIYLDKRQAFYKLMFDTKASSSVIKNIDNSITNDITRFCDATCSVFANIAKPVIDLVFFSFYLRDNLGSLGVAGIFVNYFITGYILRSYTPPLGKLSSASSAADGNYYNYHLNLINNNEEIAFYQGTEVERTKVKILYETLMERMLDVSKKKFKYTMIEDYILKYTWSGLGYIFASIPIVMTSITTNNTSEQSNMKDFIVNKRLMLSLADAGSRLMHSIKDISQLTGYANRIFTLICALHRVHSIQFNFGVSLTPATGRQLLTSSINNNNNANTGNRTDEDIIQGTVQHNFNGLRLENIDVIIPSSKGRTGHKLVKRLTLQIPQTMEPISSKANSIQDFSAINDITLPFINGPGSSLLILGPNSCGKSSIQRIIAELWPIYNKNGLLSKPAERDIFCVPQKPYFTKGGTLRDQIIYPMSTDQFFDSGYKDSLLVQVLKEVKLEYLLKRGRGWSYLDNVADWKDVLSGGEKQRMNFARIMFHKPRYVVLDEATNAISVDMEDYLFSLLKSYHFNFVTISQRPSLIKYHDLLLEITGEDATWQLQALGTDEAITTIDNEMEELEQKFGKVKEWERERKELQQKLEVI